MESELSAFPFIYRSVPYGDIQRPLVEGLNKLVDQDHRVILIIKDNANNADSLFALYLDQECTEQLCEIAPTYNVGANAPYKIYCPLTGLQLGSVQLVSAGKPGTPNYIIADDQHHELYRLRLIQQISWYELVLPNKPQKVLEVLDSNHVCIGRLELGYTSSWLDLTLGNRRALLRFTLGLARAHEECRQELILLITGCQFALRQELWQP